MFSKTTMSGILKPHIVLLTKTPLKLLRFKIKGL
jgi:hypothetical protein